MPAATKKCTSCREVKTREEFYPSKARPDGRMIYCIACAKDKSKNGGYVQTALTQRKSHLMKRYGMTIEEFDQMREDQNGLCAVCKFPHAELHIDHDHETGRIRGLLCNKCNLGIGFMRDDPEVLQAAINYLTNGTDS
jgi:hypothetical protein